MLGTPHYLSPEQALGEPATGASDLYALGVVAHEMLTGRRPFDKGTPVATALAQVNEPPPPLPPHVPRGLRVAHRAVPREEARRPSRQRTRARRAARAARGRPPGAVGDAAESVLGTAAEAEESASTTDLRPRRLDRRRRPHAHTDERAAVVPKGHVHWAWVPVFGAAVLALAAALFGMR